MIFIVATLFLLVYLFCIVWLIFIPNPKSKARVLFSDCPNSDLQTVLKQEHPPTKSLLNSLSYFFYKQIFVKKTKKSDTEPKPYLHHHITHPKTLPSISIVIPFKNEETNLKPLLLSLENQSYKGAWEIILVDDGSSDNSANLIIHYKQVLKSNIILTQSEYKQTHGLSSKQQALDKGVSCAQYDWLLFTDADMTFHTDWITLCAKNAHEKADLAYGHTIIKESKISLFNWFQKYQLEVLFTVAWNFTKASLDSSCMGNNILIRKHTYTNIGGQKAIGYSIVEDKALYSAFRKKGYNVFAMEPFLGYAYTNPSPKASGYYHQLLRWARGGIFGSITLFIAGFLFLLQTVVLIVSCAGILPLHLALVSFANLAATILFIAKGFNTIKSSENAFLFPLYYILLCLEIVAFPFTYIITPSVYWKSKKVS